MSTKKKADEQPLAANEVRLVGKVSGAPEVRSLPSGDEVGVVRVVVPRSRVRTRPDGGRGPSVDVVDCSAWEARPRRMVAGWAAGDEVEVKGALRRRFFKTAGTTVSRVEVEISSGRLLRRARSG